jgi:2Fe-2S ferredoxin
VPTVRFLPADVTVECEPGSTVFEVGRRAGVAIDTACVGQATCGLCRIRILSGEEHLAPFSAVEEKHLGNVYFLTKIRLSCQSVVDGGDVVVELAPKKKPKR